MLWDAVFFSFFLFSFLPMSVNKTINQVHSCSFARRIRIANEKNFGFRFFRTVILVHWCSSVFSYCSEWYQTTIQIVINLSTMRLNYTRSDYRKQRPIIINGTRFGFEWHPKALEHDPITHSRAYDPQIKTIKLRRCCHLRTTARLLRGARWCCSTFN